MCAHPNTILSVWCDHPCAVAFGPKHLVSSCLSSCRKNPLQIQQQKRKESQDASWDIGASHPRHNITALKAPGVSAIDGSLYFLHFCSVSTPLFFSEPLLYIEYSKVVQGARKLRSGPCFCLAHLSLGNGNAVLSAVCWKSGPVT